MLALKPLKFLLRTKLTTPATASEPQAAEAPPVTTSTRWMTAEGRVVMSTPPVMLEATTRWLSNRIRVLVVPRLRRLRSFAPAVPGTPPPLLAPYEDGGAVTWGSSRTASVMLAKASFSSWAAPTTVTGVGCV